MAAYRKSKTNGTFFQDIPKEEYVEYKKIVDKLSRKKKVLREEVEKLKKIRTNYQNYLMKNPYKEEKAEQERIVDKLRSELMQLIPDKWGSNN